MVFAWQHQVLTWTNVHLSSNVYCGIPVRAISQEVHMDLICDMCSEITILKWLPDLPGTTEFLIMTAYLWMTIACFEYM